MEKKARVELTGRDRTVSFRTLLRMSSSAVLRRASVRCLILAITAFAVMGFSGTTTAGHAPDAPDAPAAPTLTPGNRTIKVSWRAPSDNGKKISEYTISWTLASDTNFDKPIDTATARGTTYTITGLSNGTGYAVQVRARNASGYGDWSPPSHARPGTYRPPSPPREIPVEPPAEPLAEPPPTVSLILTPAMVPEANGVSTVTAKLDRTSSVMTRVKVSVQALPPARVADIELSANTTLTIAAGETTSAGVVTITAVDNRVDEPDKQVRITGAVTGAQGITGPADETLTITDDDEAGVTVSPTRVLVTEAPGEGHTATYTVVLDSAPTDTVTVAVRSADTAIATVSPASLTFTPDNWSEAQGVTVSGVDDGADNAGDQRVVQVGHSVTSADTQYAEVEAAGVTVTVTDDDEPPEVVEFLSGRELCVGEVEELVLSAYFSDPDGDVLTYETSRVADSNIVGISVSGDRLVLSGLMAGTTTVSLVAVDPGGLEVSQEVDVTVCRESDEVARIRHEQVGKAVLPRVSLALTSDTLRAITRRVEALGDKVAQETSYSLGSQWTAGASLERTIYNVLKSADRGLAGGGLDWGRLLDESSFNVSLAGLDGQGGGHCEPGRLCDVSVWGQGTYRNLSQDAGATAVDWDGELVGAQAGMDIRLHTRLLAGTAVHWHKGWFDWTEGALGQATQGEYEVEMTGVQPYAGWTSRSGGVGVWGTVGYGWGHVKVGDEFRDKGAQRSDSDLVSGALGVTGRLLSEEGWLPGGATTLRAKGEVLVARWDVEGNGLIEPLAVDTQRVRLALELAHDGQIACVDLMPMLEVGLRHDGGDGVNYTGLEVGAGLRYLHPCLGLTLEGRVRALAFSGKDYEEWGGELQVSMDPGPRHEGLRWSVTTGYGEAASSEARLWDEERTRRMSSAAYRPRARFAAEVEYGWALDGVSVVTPYSRLTWLGDGEARYRLGGRWRVGEALELSLTGERRRGSHEAAAAHDHRILLEGRLEF